MPKQDVRELHRDCQFEVYEDLLDERFKVTSDIVALRVEIAEMTQKLERLEDARAAQEEVEIADKRKHGGREKEGDLQEQVLVNTARLKELEDENESLVAQFNFVSKLFGAAEENELKNYVGLQSHAFTKTKEELEEIKSKIDEKNAELDSPELDERRTKVRKNKKKIQKLGKELEKLKREEKKLMEEFGKRVEGVTNEEKREMEGEVLKLKQRLSVERHRKAAREKEKAEFERVAQNQKAAFGDISAVKKRETRTVRERDRFRRSMKRKMDEDMENVRRELRGEEEPKSEAQVVQYQEQEGVFHITQNKRQYEGEQKLDGDMMKNALQAGELSASESKESSEPERGRESGDNEGKVHIESEKGALRNGFDESQSTKSSSGKGKREIDTNEDNSEKRHSSTSSSSSSKSRDNDAKDEFLRDDFDESQHKKSSDKEKDEFLRDDFDESQDKKSSSDKEKDEFLRDDFDESQDKKSSDKEKDEFLRDDFDSQEHESKRDSDDSEFDPDKRRDNLLQKLGFELSDDDPETNESGTQEKKGNGSGFDDDFEEF